MATCSPDAGELLDRYCQTLPYPLYPVQQDALIAWFTSPHGVLVCAPTGTGKTLIAEAAAYEALLTGKRLYYSTPLIALTEQKFSELQHAVSRWGFQPDQVGLITGHRRVNPEAPILVVVAEVLLNRLLHADVFNFADVSGVVMDEFHCFSDPERGMVWEFSIALLPTHVRLLLLSATVGNAFDFVRWLEQTHEKRLEIVQSTERKIPLTFQWVGDSYLADFVEQMASGDDATRRTPALIFCFNREACWDVADELRGRRLLSEHQRESLLRKIEQHSWQQGAGPRLRQLLQRGIGVHHAGVLPKYRRIVERLFQEKLLSVCVCTETLAAGINLPARSVVLPSLMKGRLGEQKLLDASSAHQIFGRAGRPQYDTHGFVFALAHEDDVRILKWKEKYDQIPEDTKDPQLLKKKKELWKKRPTRHPDRQYWDEQHFHKLRQSSPGSLRSQGHLPWRFLAYLLLLNPQIEPLRMLIHKRLLDPTCKRRAIKQLHQMLLMLHQHGFVRLEPAPNEDNPPTSGTSRVLENETRQSSWLSQQLQQVLNHQWQLQGIQIRAAETPQQPYEYLPEWAYPTERLKQLLIFRTAHPLFALFVNRLLPMASLEERWQIWDAMLEFPPTLKGRVRVPNPHKMPPGRLAREYVDIEVVQRGLWSAGDLYPEPDPKLPPELRQYPPTLSEKLRDLFLHEYPAVEDLKITSVWILGELLEHGGNFARYISGCDLSRQEGLIFRHLLRMVQLLNEFAQVPPDGVEPETWRQELQALALKCAEACRQVDPESTDYSLTHLADHDVVALDFTPAPLELPLSETIPTITFSDSSLENMDAMEEENSTF